MKKLFSLVALAGMFMLMSFVYQPLQTTPGYSHCGTYAVESADAEFPDENADWYEYYEAYNWYLNFCLDSEEGSEMMTPIFIG